MTSPRPRITADRPAHHADAVAICCDARFQPYASFLAWQLATAHRDRGFDIVVASLERLAPLPLLSELGVRHVAVDTATAFASFSRDSRRSHATYLWMALPMALGYRRILGLDADIFHERGDLGALLSIDMGGFAIGAVRDNKQWRTPGRRVREYREMGWPSAPYFNAGVILIDCAQFIAERLLERTVDFAQTSPIADHVRDQGLVNCVLHGNWAELSPVWNWQYTWASSLLVAATDPNLIHFIGAAKPWRDASGALPLRYTAAYETFLATHFPDAERARGLSRRRVPQVPAVRRVLFRHWRTAPAMQAYLARFPDDLTVRSSSV